MTPISSFFSDYRHADIIEVFNSMSRNLHHLLDFCSQFCADMINIISLKEI